MKLQPLLRFKIIQQFMAEYQEVVQHQLESHLICLINLRMAQGMPRRLATLTKANMRHVNADSSRTNFILSVLALLHQQAYHLVDQSQLL